VKVTAAAGALPFPYLEVRGVHKRFGGVHALRGVSLSIQRGEIYHLLGENGCGKSTLIKIISGAQPPDEGDLLIEGEARVGLTAIGALSAGIETVYQDLSLLPNLSVAENVALSEQLVLHRGRLNRRLDRVRLVSTATRALEAVKLPTHAAFLGIAASELPIAMRQLVAIARAIATQAKLVIMDEPTTALTRREIENLSRVVLGLSEQGVAVLFVSHKLDECIALGGQAVVMRDGRKVVQGPIGDFTNASLAHWMTGKHLEGQRLRGVAKPGAELLSVRRLGRRDQFTDVSFELRQGEILGITGLLDSGRNELALSLAGVLAADRGQLSLDGKPMSMRTPSEAIAHRVGYVPEDRLSEGLFLDKPIRDNVITAVLHKVMGRFGLIDVSKAQALAETTVADLQIAAPNVLTPVQSLSGGNQQRVLIGRWLAIAPRVLILHGPTVGVDVGSKDTIYKIIQRLTAKDAQGRSSGMGVIIISDDLPELLQNCDRILLMNKGRITQDFEAAQLNEADLYAALVADAEDAGADAASRRPPQSQRDDPAKRAPA
jgi:simple sugar transport system ATP-binding protein